MDNQTTPIRSTDRPTGQIGPTGYYYDAQEIERSSVSWRAIWAGLFVTFFTYLVLLSLGIAIGGSSLQGDLGSGGASGSAYSIGSGIWVVIASLASLFVGGYYCARVSGFISPRVGGTQGIVITALFFFVMMMQASAAVGLLGRGVGSAVGAIGGAAGDLASNPQVQDTIDSALGDLNLKSPPDQVAKGIATRLIRGDTDGAKNYLARQAGISPAEADQRLNNLNNQFQATLAEVGRTTAKVVGIAGWTLFGSLLLGGLAAVFGGISGARKNIDASLATYKRPSDRIKAA